MRVLSKSDFAREANVTPGRVSQWIAEGKIGHDAIDGEGRSAKIIVDVALAQIRSRRDVGQSLGNGLQTRINNIGEFGPSTVELPQRSDDVAHQIQLERLKQERRKNEQASVDEAIRQSRLVPADDVRAQMSRLARQVDEANASMLADFAAAIAGKYSLPQRDVLHLLREVRNSKKALASATAAKEAADIAPTVEFTVDQP